MIKTNTGKHTPQEPHTKENCKINEHEHAHPETDCGHRVESGPGLDIERDGHTGPGIDIERDKKTGPGVGL